MSSHDHAGPAGTTRRSSAHLAGPRAGASCYAAADLLVLRAALAPHAMVPGRGPARGLDRGPDGRPAEDPARLHELIQAFRNDPALAAALELASPDLAQTLTRTEQESTDRPASEVRRMVIALTGYLLRLRHRATPFGLFAGTALIAPDTAAGGGIGTGHSLLLRPPPRWLAGLVAALESDFALPDLAPQVRIAPAPSLYRTGPLHVLADRSAGGPGHWRTDTSVRQSGLLDAVLVMAAGDRAGNGGIRYCALLDLLHAAAPALDREKLAGYVTGFLSARFLGTDLLPPPGDADPLSYLIERLDHHPVAGRLDGLRRDLREASRSPRAADIRRLRGQMRSIEPGGADLVADMLLDTDLRVPLLAVREVEHAASVAWSCPPSRPVRSLAGLHQAMLSRYGLDRPVPLAELLDPTESLGLDGVSPQGEAAAGAARDRLLTGLALDALAAGRAELCLDRAVQRRLEAVRGACGFPPSADVFTEIVAASAEALNRGAFLVVLGSDGGPGAGGSPAGRLSRRWRGPAGRMRSATAGCWPARSGSGVPAPGPCGGEPGQRDGLDRVPDRPGGSSAEAVEPRYRLGGPVCHRHPGAAAAVFGAVRPGHPPGQLLDYASATRRCRGPAASRPGLRWCRAVEVLGLGERRCAAVAAARPGRPGRAGVGPMGPVARSPASRGGGYR